MEKRLDGGIESKMREGKEERGSMVLSDLHCDSLYFDASAFKLILKRLEEEKIKCETLHIGCDVTEGKFNHVGRHYDVFAFTSSV